MSLVISVNSLKISTFVSVSDLWEHLDVVPPGAVWVQVHADWPQLVQLLLRPSDAQGESVYRLHPAIATVTAAAKWQYNGDIVDVSVGGAVGLWSHERIWSELHRCLHRGEILKGRLHVFLFFFLGFCAFVHMYKLSNGVKAMAAVIKWAAEWMEIC